MSEDPATAFRRVVAQWCDGEISRGNFFHELLEEGLRTNLDEAVAACPEDLRAEFLEDLYRLGPEYGDPEDFILIQGGVTEVREHVDRVLARQQQELERFRYEIVPAVREWLARRNQST